MREEDYPALLVVPDGFTKGLLHGERVQLELVKNPSQSFMPVAAQQAAEVVALYLSVGAHVLEGFGPQIQNLLDGEEDSWSDSVALAGLVAAAGFEVTRVERVYHDPVHRRLLRQYLFGWLFRMIGIDYARQIVLVARRPAG